MKTTIKDILDDMILKLEELVDEKLVLQKLYRDYHEKLFINESDEDKDFYMSILDTLEDVITLENFKPNDMMRALYELNIERIRELELYALRLYKLYNEETSQEISYLENIKDRNIQKIREANEKKNISVIEFELVYGYSSTAQKGFRSRLNDPIPFIQKEFNSKISYKKSDVDKWLGDIKH